MAPPPTSAPSPSQAQAPTPLIPAGTVQAIAATTTMIILPKDSTCPCLGQNCLGAPIIHTTLHNNNSYDFMYSL